MTSAEIYNKIAFFPVIKIRSFNKKNASWEKQFGARLGFFIEAARCEFWVPSRRPAPCNRKTVGVVTIIMLRQMIEHLRVRNCRVRHWRIGSARARLSLALPAAAAGKGPCEQRLLREIPFWLLLLASSSPSSLLRMILIIMNHCYIIVT